MMNVQTRNPESQQDAEPLQLLTFKLDDEFFATNISQVQEVLDYTPVTKVPRTPDFMRGVINLRGNVVPVIDLRLQFGMSETVPNIDTCVIIIEVQIDEESTVLGILADSVQEVVELDRSQLGPPPRLGNRIDTRFIQAMGKYNEQFLIVLDVQKVFSSDELANVCESLASEQLASDESVNELPGDGN